MNDMTLNPLRNHLLKIIELRQLFNVEKIVSKY